MASDKDKKKQEAGYLRGYEGYIDTSQLQALADEGIRFDPNEYVNLDAYKSNKWGTSAYEKDLAMVKYYSDLAMQNWQNTYNEERLEEDRKYNSFVNQSLEMSKAGINPDLQGVNLGNMSSQPSADGSSSIPSASNFPNFVNEGQNIVQLIKSVGLLTSDLASGAFDAMHSQQILNASALDLALASSQFALNDLQGIPQGMHNEYLKSLPLPRSMRSRIKQIYNSAGASKKLSLAGFKFDQEYMNNESAYYKMINDVLFNPQDFNKDNKIDSSDWSSVWKPVTDALYDEMKSSLESKNASNKLKKGETDMLNTLKEPLQQVVKNLKQKSEEGKQWAFYALIALYGALSASSSAHYSASTNSETGNLTHSFGF